MHTPTNIFEFYICLCVNTEITDVVCLSV